jgi:hypothetical protein
MPPDAPQRPGHGARAVPGGLSGRVWNRRAAVHLWGERFRPGHVAPLLPCLSFEWLGQ